MELRPNRPDVIRSATIRYCIAAIVICCAACGKEHGMKGEPSSGPTSAKLVSAANAATLPSAIAIANDATDDGQ